MVQKCIYIHTNIQTVCYAARPWLGLSPVPPLCLQGKSQLDVRPVKADC